MAVPEAPPVMIPKAASIEAMEASLVDHTPPEIPLKKVVVRPEHTWSTPVIGVGMPFTDTVVLLLQPVPRVYVTFVLPAEIPDRIPELRPIVPTAIAELLQVPPEGR